MTFEECDVEAKKGVYLSLEKDGETTKAMFIGEPIFRMGQYGGKDRKQFCFPVVTVEGLAIWTVGVRLYKWLRDNWKVVCNKTCSITRHGKPKDTNTTYAIIPCKTLKRIQVEFDGMEADELAELMDTAVDIQT